LLPGTYTVTAILSNFKPATTPNVVVGLGSIKTVDLSLQLASVSEVVTVMGEASLVDVKSSARAANIRGEQIDLLPHNRDFSSLVTQAPGANQEFKSNGIMIDGSSGAENRFIIDGIETTDLIGGASGKDLLADFVEEVQVKSTGYPAEYGGSTGGVINVQTKSGTNNYGGVLLGVYQGSNLQGSANPTLRAVFGVPTQAEYHTYPKDDNTRFEPGATLGGPIVVNKAWFFAAYQPSNTKVTRTRKSGHDRHRERDGVHDFADAARPEFLDERHEPIRQQAAHPCRVQRQLAEEYRSACHVDWQRQPLYFLHQGHEVPELVALRHR